MPDTHAPQQLEPWQWSEEHWRKLVEAGARRPRYRPKAWKDGARCAVALSFDSDHETNELRDGGKSIGRCAGASTATGSACRASASSCETHGVKATFYVPAVSALLHPEEQRALVAEGHEIGIHGWIHELNSVLPHEAERDLMLRSADTLEKITGKRAVGMRTPSWDFSPNTLAIEKEMGLLYDSSLMADEDCYELLLDGEPTGVIELPVEWVRDDAVYFAMHRFSSLRPYTPPTDVLDIFRRELDAAWEEGGIFQLTMHPHIIGYRSRIWIVDELIRHAKAKGKVWFATHARGRALRQGARGVSKVASRHRRRARHRPRLRARAGDARLRHRPGRPARARDEAHRGRDRGDSAARRSPTRPTSPRSPAPTRWWTMSRGNGAASTSC